jgi:uncharacterized phage-associated protein
MATVFDVAAYILSRSGPMVAMKLQKLCYYSHAWHLVWEERPLFNERIEAWANGPVVRELYREHRLQWEIDRDETFGGDPARLEPGERETIDSVLDFYGSKSAHWLSELTHREEPWRAARRRDSLADGERGTAQIFNADMLEYYDGLTSAAPPEDE